MTTLNPIQPETWSARRILVAYFHHLRPKVGRIGPKGYDNPNLDRTNPKFEAFVRVLRTPGYEEREDSLRQDALSLPESELGKTEVWSPASQEFLEILRTDLEDDPFFPGDDVPPHRVGQAFVELSTAAAIAGHHKTTVWRWAEKGLLTHRTGIDHRVWIQIDSLLKHVEMKDRHRRHKALRRSRA